MLWNGNMQKSKMIRISRQQPPV